MLFRSAPTQKVNQESLRGRNKVKLSDEINISGHDIGVVHRINRIVSWNGERRVLEGDSPGQVQDIRLDAECESWGRLESKVKTSLPGDIPIPYEMVGLESEDPAA